MNTQPWLAQPNFKSAIVTCSVAATTASAAATSSGDGEGSFCGGGVGVCRNSVFVKDVFISSNLSRPVFELLLPIAMLLFSLLPFCCYCCCRWFVVAVAANAICYSMQ